MPICWFTLALAWEFTQLQIWLAWLPIALEAASSSALCGNHFMFILDSLSAEYDNKYLSFCWRNSDSLSQSGTLRDMQKFRSKPKLVRSTSRSLELTPMTPHTTSWSQSQSIKQLAPRLPSKLLNSRKTQFTSLVLASKASTRNQVSIFLISPAPKG